MVAGLLQPRQQTQLGLKFLPEIVDVRATEAIQYPDENATLLLEIQVYTCLERISMRLKCPKIVMLFIERLLAQLESKYLICERAARTAYCIWSVI